MSYDKMIIHDLTGDELSQLIPETEKYLIIDANIKAAHCKGCFGCWLKTPGKCVFKDRFQNIGAAMAQVETIFVISRNCYGGYSPGVKKVFDRSISASLPFFTYRGGRIHHFCRYKNKPSAVVYLYGKISDFEKQIASELVQVNSINMGWRDVKLLFAEGPSELSI